MHEVPFLYILSNTYFKQGLLWLQCEGFSLWWLLLLWGMISEHTGFSNCGMWAQELWLPGSRAQAQQLSRMDLVAPRYVESSQTRDQIHVSCVGRWSLYH